jgi:tetratricopeptide (TPR) repeat protein
MRIATTWLLLICPLIAAGNPRVEFALGVLAECRGDETKAAEHFENARELDPTATALMNRGVAQRMTAGDRAGAAGLFREFAAARPNDLPVQLAYADFLTEQGRDDTLASKLAEKTLDASLAKHPGHPEIVRRLASLNRSRAPKLIEHLAADDPTSVILFASISRSLHDSDVLAAREEIDRRFVRCLEVHPENAPLAREASEHFRNTGRNDEAIAVLKRHIAAAPWSLDLRTRLGILYFIAKRDLEGEAVLKELLTIHPRHPLAHQALAKRYRWSGNHALATDHSAELLKIRGGSASEFLQLASEYLATGRPKEARILLEKAVFDHPDQPTLRMKLAIASRRDPATHAQASRIFREAEAAAETDITDPEFLMEFAETLIESGQSEAAEARLRAAIRSWPPEAKQETAASLRRLAQLWETEQRNAEAAKALRQRADALDPGD